MMHKVSQSIVVRHREYLGNIKGRIGFINRQSYVLNPGLDSTFPWLAQIAKAYQEYRFTGLVFHYIPTSGTALSGTNPALGTVMVQTSYRSNDTLPSSKIEMLNEYCASEARPCDAFNHPIECNPIENPLRVQYVRNTPVPAGDSQLMYDLGVTQFAVEGQLADDTVLGDIWCTYEVELKKPIIRSNVTALEYSLLQLNSTTITGANMFTSTYPGTSWTGTDNIGLIMQGRTIIFPSTLQGSYVVQMMFFATTTWLVATNITSVTYTNCSSIGTPGILADSTGTYTANVSVVYVTVTVTFGGSSSQPSITFSSGTLTPATTTAAVQVFVTKIS
jgi:hypothetical protein